MNFQDELNTMSRTPQEAAKIEANIKREEASRLAKQDYNEIKEMIKGKGQKGEYENIGGKKKICFYYKTGNIQGLFKLKTDIKNYKQLFTWNTQYTAMVLAIDSKKVEYYKEELNALAKIDQISLSVIGIYLEAGTHRILQEFRIPGNLVGASTVFVETAIKCEVQY